MPLRPAWLLTLLLALPSIAAAQDFTGDWVLVDTVGDLPAGSSSPLGHQGSITHVSDRITFTPAVAARDSQPERTYTLDGAETRHSVTTASGERHTTVARLRRASTALVITTTTVTPRMVDPARGWDEVTTLVLDASGRLVVSIVTPNLWPEGTSSTARWTYRRSQ